MTKISNYKSIPLVLSFKKECLRNTRISSVSTNTVGDPKFQAMAQSEGKRNVDPGLQKVNLSHGKVLKFHMHSFCL